MNANKYAEVTQAVKVVRPFDETLRKWRVKGESVAVLSGYLGAGRENLSGPLAERVKATMLEYTTQYLTGGNRKRMPGHVAYYVTANGYVLGYVAANGDGVIAPVSDVPAEIVAAVHAGLNDARERQLYYMQHENELHEPGHIDGEGFTFELYERSTNVPVQAAEVTATFTDRDEAYAAMLAADDLANGHQAWIKRVEVAQ